MTKTGRIESNIYLKIYNVQQKIMGVDKAGKNDYHKYNYVKAEDVIRTIRPLLLQEGLLFIPDVQEVNKENDYAHVVMRFTIVDIDTGKKIETIYHGEGKDNNDKAFYKAYTGAIKYYFIQTFLIPTGDDPEQDMTNQERQQQTKKQPNKNNNEIKGPMKFVQKQKDLWAKYNNGDLTGFEEWHDKTSPKYNGFEKGVLEHLEKLIEARKQKNG